MRKRDQVMLCYPYEEKRFLQWGSKAIIQPKLDGDRCIAKVGQEVNLYSSTGILITSVPHINKELKSIIGNCEGVELDGEIYCHGMIHSKISGLVRTKWGAPEEGKNLQYHIFDIPTYKDIRYEKRIDTLPAFCSQHQSKIIKVISHSTVSTIDDIFLHLKEYISQGYEGFVLKHPMSIYERKRSINWMKFKPRKNDLYLILGSIEEYSIHNEPKGQLGALILIGIDETNRFTSQQFKVGTGFTCKQRKELWKAKESLTGKLCSIKYQELSKDSIPREPVFIEIL